MKFYKTAQVVQLVGTVGMSDAQAKRRKSRMTPVDKRPGVYELPEPLDFKAGEIIGLDQVPKALIRVLVGGDSGGEPTPHDPKTGEPIMAADKKPKKGAGDSGGEPT